MTLGKENTAIVAEIGANHSKSLQKTQQMVHAAKWAGATAVKVQMYEPADMTLKRYTPEFRITEGPWQGYVLWDLYEQAAMPTVWVPELLELATSLGLGFIASVFSPRMVDRAEEYGVPVLKVSSFELTYEALQERLTHCDKPLIFSLGCATLPQIEAVVARHKEKKIILLKCCSQYPAPLDAMNLATIPDLRSRFGVPIGLSDHTQGCVCAVTASILGAVLIERHFKIDNAGLDVAFSANPQEFRTMVETIRAAELAIGEPNYEPTSTKFTRKKVDGQWVRTVN